jgi:iron complex outermembrane receptor protein
MSEVRSGFYRNGVGVGAIAVALWASPAIAQESSARTADPAAEAGGAQGGTGTRGGISDQDIIVTAIRESTLLSKTPVAMTAITGEGLRDAGITNPTQLTDTVPNVQITRGNGLQITVRGVTSTDGTEKGDPSVAFLQDGVYIARPQQQEVSFYDLERVEVLRGPQGTLYGRNTTAGVLNIISARPQHEFGGSIDVSYGNFDALNATGVINIPAGESVAFRAAVNIDRRDSYIIPPASDAFSISPFKNNLSGRVSALFDPTPDIQVLLRADYSTLKGKTPNGVPTRNFFPSATTGTTLTDTEPRYIDSSSKAQRRSTFTQPWDPYRDDYTWGVMGQVDWNLGPVALTYIGSTAAATRRRSTANISRIRTSCASRSARARRCTARSALITSARNRASPSSSRICSVPAPISASRRIRRSRGRWPASGS